MFSLSSKALFVFKLEYLSPDYKNMFWFQNKEDRIMLCQKTCMPWLTPLFPITNTATTSAELRSSFVAMRVNFNRNCVANSRIHNTYRTWIRPPIVHFFYFFVISLSFCISMCYNCLFAIKSVSTYPSYITSLYPPATFLACKM